MMLYKVTSLAFDPDARTAYYTEDNYAFRDLMAVNVDTGKKRMLLQDARIGDLVVNPADKSIWGIRHQNGFATIVRIPAALRRLQPDPHVQIWRDPVRPRHFARRHDALRLVRRDQRQAIGAGVEARQPDGRRRARRGRAARRCRPSTPEGFVFAPDGKALYGTSYYTGVSNVFRFDIATQKYDAVSNASTGFFRPMPQPDGSLIAYEYSGEGLQPVRFQPEGRRRPRHGRIPRHPASSTTHPELKAMGRRLAGQDRPRSR